MKINLNAVVTNLAGNPFTEKTEDGATVGLTLRNACKGALLAVSPKKEITGQEKYERYAFCVKLDSEESEIELTAEQITKLKSAVGEAYPNPAVVGKVWDMLEGKS